MSRDDFAVVAIALCVLFLAAFIVTYTIEMSR